MNAFNRAVVILSALLLIVLLIVAAVVPNTVLQNSTYALGRAADALRVGWPTSYLIFLGVDIVLIFLLIVLLWLELRPRAVQTVTLRSDTGTLAEVNTASIEQTLEYRIRQIPDVLDVNADVRGRRGGVNVLVDLQTIPEIDIPSKVEQVRNVIYDLVEGRMGIQIVNHRIRMRHVGYEKGFRPHEEPHVTTPTMRPEPLPPAPAAPPAPADQDVVVEEEESTSETPDSTTTP